MTETDLMARMRECQAMADRLTNNQAAVISDELFMDAAVCIRSLITELDSQTQRISELELSLSRPVILPYCSSSAVCEMEASYAAAVSDCRQAIRNAGYPIEGDD